MSEKLRFAPLIRVSTEAQEQRGICSARNKHKKLISRT